MSQTRRRRSGGELVKTAQWGLMKRRILELLAELDPSKTYSYTELVHYLVSNGVTVTSASYYVIHYLVAVGVLERVWRGAYRINKKRLEEMLRGLD
jgi:hypothetical protein